MNKPDLRALGLNASLGLLLSCLPPVCLAQTPAAPPPHVSLTALSARLGSVCDGEARCQAQRLGWRLGLGAALPPELRLDAGPLAIDTVEVAYSTLGQAKTSHPFVKRVFTGAPVPSARTLNAERQVSPSALSLSALGRIALVDDVNAQARLGLAVVSTTVGRAESGASVGSVTENRLAPIGGLGVTWAPLPGLTVNLDWTLTRYAADGVGGPVQAWGLGLTWTP